MKSFLPIDTIPTLETHVVKSNGTTSIAVSQKIEAVNMMILLQKRFPNCTDVSLKISHYYHDNGTSLGIHIIFDTNNRNSISQALFMKSNVPLTWSDTSTRLWKPEFADEQLSLFSFQTLGY